MCCTLSCVFLLILYVFVVYCGLLEVFFVVFWFVRADFACFVHFLLSLNAALNAVYRQMRRSRTDERFYIRFNLFRQMNSFLPGL